MRILLLALSLVLVASTAEATTCNQRAANCVKLGGSKDTCYHPTRMSICKRTGEYVAPSGRTWEAKDR